MKKEESNVISIPSILINVAFMKLHEELEDLKVFLESAIVNVEMDVKQKEKRNPWLHLNQHFYNAKKENISLELTKEDFALIKNRTTEERSGIYFKIRRLLEHCCCKNCKRGCLFCRKL